MNNVCKSKLKIFWSICVLFYSSFVCMSAYANVYFKTICECKRQKIFMCLRSIAGVPFDSDRRFWLPCYCAPLVCVSEVIELLAVCWYYKPNTKTVHVYTAVCTWHARTTHTYTHHTMMNFPHDSSSTKSLSKLRRNIQNCSDESAPPI